MSGKWFNIIHYTTLQLSSDNMALLQEAHS